MKRIGFLGSALILSTLGIAACTGTGDDTSAAALAPAMDAGQDSATSEVDASLAADASFPTEAGGDASPLAEAGDATVLTDAAHGEAGTEDGALDAGGASTPSYALFVGTDFVNAELAVVNLHPDSVAGQLPVADQDSVPYASGGYGFVLEHTLGKVIALDHAQPWMARTTIDINDSPDAAAYASNPRTVLVTTSTKAYVARYASNVIKIVDVASGTVIGSLDLTAFVAPDDTDGLVDVEDAAYDAATGHAYFLLQRINQFDYGPGPDYVGACLASHGEIVGVDVSNDSLLDLNGAAAGSAIDLLGDNPASLTLDLAGGRFIVPDSGCYQAQAPDAGSDGGPLPRLGRGIESVALSTGTPAWLYQTSDLDRLSGLVWVDETHAFVSQGSDWFAWNPSQTTLGSVVANFPQAPFYDGARIVGLAFGPPDAGSDAGSVWSVVALDVGTSQVRAIAGNPFQNVVPSSGYGVTSALLH